MVENGQEMLVVVLENSNVSKVMKVVPTESYKELLSNNLVSESGTVLTDREKDVLKLVIDGKSNPEIATELIISVHTVKAHVCSILQKLCVTDRVQAAVKAVRERLVDF